MCNSQDHPYLQGLAGEPHSSLRLHGAMLAIWHMRPATQKRFPLHRRRTSDCLRFLVWCATDGRDQHSRY
jgi:hypothetical protein